MVRQQAEQQAGVAHRRLERGGVGAPFKKTAAAAFAQ